MISTDAWVTIASVLVTVGAAVLHTNARFTALETKVDLMFEQFWRELTNGKH